MRTQLEKFPWFGVALIVVGLVMLLHRLDMVNFSWQTAVWGLIAIFGGFKIARGFALHKQGAAFWGTILLVAGGYKLLEETDLFYLPSYLLFPWTVVLVGVGFLVMFLCMPRNWHVIVPALFFICAGAVMILSELGYFNHWEVVDAIRTYWPIALIIFGISLLLNRKASA